VWIANPANSLLGSAAAPNTVYAARWNGAAWSAPEAVAQVAHPILRSELLYDGTSGFLVMSVDTDDDTETDADQELALVRLVGGVWQPLEWLTSNTVADANPRIARGPSGAGTILAWVQGDSVKIAADFAVGSPVHSLSVPYSSNVADFRFTRSGDGRLALVWTQPSEFSSDLWGVFYDPATGTWGDKRQLTADLATEKEATAAFLGGSLVSLYGRRDLGLRQLSRTTAEGRMIEVEQPNAGPTDLVMVQTTLGRDLSLAGGSLSVDPPNAAPGVPATLAVTVTNLGELPVTGPTVAFYNGDPAAGGVEIGRVSSASPLPTGGRATVSVPWTVPATTGPLTVFAVADPDQVSGDRDRSNNTQSLRLALPDLQVADAGWSGIDGTRISVVARVTNNGSTPAAASGFTFRRDSGTGTLMHQETVPALSVGQSFDVGFAVDAAGWPNGALIVAQSDEANAVVEADETNNVSSMSVALRPASVDLGVSLSAAPKPVTVGQSLVYTATVSNVSGDPAHGVSLTVVLPGGATIGTVTPSQGACETAGATVTCSLFAAAPASQATVSVGVVPGVPGQATATATVSTSEPDANLSNNSATDSTIVADVGRDFFTIPPCRVLDSRDPSGPFGGQPLLARQERTITVTERCGVPAGARAVALNVIAASPTDDGHLRLYPGGTTRPEVSTVNFRAGVTRANNAVAPLGLQGDLAVYSGQASGSVHVIVDVSGYFE
jgi:uncharacterized repeat protein (TIGR01451 family)